jgi:hypothetical protein
MAQFESLGNLPERATSQMHAADDGMVVCPDPLNVAFRFGQLGSRSPSFLEKFLGDHGSLLFVYSC